MGLAHAEPLDDAPVLEAVELYRFYHSGDDETRALRGVSVAADPGDLIAIVGPSGSGKSTLLACLAGIDEPDGGHVLVAGRRITRRSEPIKAALRGSKIGVVLQSGNLLEHLTVAQNVATARSLAPGKAERSVRETLGLVGIEHRANSFPTMLSGGESVRAAIAVALANDPPVLLADEPTGELDQKNEAMVLDLFEEMVARKIAIVVATHSEIVAERATRVVHLRDGRTVNV